MQDNNTIIICVDDDQSMSFVLKFQLEQNLPDNYSVESFNCGEEALEFVSELIAENESVPLVITDQMMPGLKGHEVISKVGEISPSTKCILLTGYASSDILEDIINKKEVPVISKPWNQEDLIKQVTKLLPEKN